jgi:hypothetical protein
MARVRPLCVPSFFCGQSEKKVVKKFVCSVFVSLLVSAALPAMAQTPTRVSVTAPAPIYVLPDAKLVPLRTAAVGSALNVQRVEGEWYRVEFQDPQYGRRVGYIEKRYVADQQAALDLTVADDVQQRPAFAPQASASAQQPSAFAQSSAFTPTPKGQAVTGLSIPTFETMLGWGIQHADGGTNLYGWSLNMAGSVTPWFSIVGEVTGNYDWGHQSNAYIDVHASVQEHAFLGGPKFVGRLVGGRVNPFGQFQAGVLVDHGAVDMVSSLRFLPDIHDSGTMTLFALQPGGGVDIGLSDRVALRMQVDARVGFKEGEHATLWRFTPGVVIRTGSMGGSK